MATISKFVRILTGTQFGQFRCSSTADAPIRMHALPRKPISRAKYGVRHTATALPGDGIGSEMMEHIRRIFIFAHIPMDFEEMELSSKDPSDDALENAITAIDRNGVAIKGNIEAKFDDPTFKSRNMELRRRLDLFANVIHCLSIPSIPARHSDLDLVLIRESTEGHEYSGLEHEAVKGVIETIKIFIRRNVELIARFTYAVLNIRPRIAAIDKANIQKLGDGLFLKVCKEIADTEYKSKGLHFDSLIVDSACMQLISRPQQFNGLLLMPNLCGNINSNCAYSLVGGPLVFSLRHFSTRATTPTDPTTLVKLPNGLFWDEDRLLVINNKNGDIVKVTDFEEIGYQLIIKAREYLFTTNEMASKLLRPLSHTELADLDLMGYKCTPDVFLHHAEVFLQHATKQIHRVQLCEKLWGATTWALRYYAMSRGVNLHSHRSNSLIVDFMADEYMKEEPKQQFEFSKNFEFPQWAHRNFHRDFLSVDKCKIYIACTREFMNQLFALHKKMVREQIPFDAEKFSKNCKGSAVEPIRGNQLKMTKRTHQ